MAIFQYNIEIIPKEFVKKHKSDFQSAIDDYFAWEEFSNPSTNFINSIRSLLPINNSWSDVEEFRSDDNWGSQIQIYKTDGKFEAVVLKFSPAQDNIKILENFIRIADEEKCLLYAEESTKVLEPNLSEIIEDLKVSKAYKFMEDPIKTIEESATQLNE
ncbi:hypothetical protein [Halarcobacter sp.]|uniref:hypothetical protein n=1 Tax=Halarcobacter sp. TaxID=2321133 RepID=UPI002AA8C7DD|nr:hypothetical protein [Halarcobacter sp.]